MSILLLWKNRDFPHTFLTEICVPVRFSVLTQLAELRAVSHYLNATGDSEERH